MEKRESPSKRICQMFAYTPCDTNVLREEQRRFASREYFFQKIVDENGNTIAGCFARVDEWKYGTINLWVDEPYRNQGIGSSLLSDIEREAKKNGACIVMIDARDWNVDFFKKLGYTVYCTLKDYPNGYSKYKLKKQL